MSSASMSSRSRTQHGCRLNPVVGVSGRMSKGRDRRKSDPVPPPPAGRAASSSGAGTSARGSACQSSPVSSMWNEASSTKIASPCWSAVTRRVLNERPSRVRSTLISRAVPGRPGRMKYECSECVRRSSPTVSVGGAEGLAGHLTAEEPRWALGRRGGQPPVGADGLEVEDGVDRSPPHRPRGCRRGVAHSAPSAPGRTSGST